MSAPSLVSRARGLVAAYLPRGLDIEEAIWFAATVLHDVWLMPTCPDSHEEKSA
jgi:hypothetical protein